MFLRLPEFQPHHTLRLLLLYVNYIQLQRKSNDFHGSTIKTKRIETRSNTSTRNYDVCGALLTKISLFFLGHDFEI